MSQNESEKEIENLKRELERERLRHESELESAEYRAKVQKSNSTETLAWVSLLLLCAIAMIFGFMGIGD